MTRKIFLSKLSTLNPSAPLRTSFQLSTAKGFTLLELIIVFAIISIMTTLGIAAFVEYNRSQTLNSAALDLANILQLAKSRAQSQVKPVACTGTLDGYKVILCDLSDCLANDVGKNYALYFVCNDNIGAFSVDAKTLPSGITFTSTTPSSIFFRVLTGGVEGSGSIVLSGSGKTKTITIDSAGNVDSN